MQILSSLSGLQFSAASAGYAPTNSADVSAIASAYQVVSATATQLYAGTSYVTSVNSTPISASRAGNAANASLANSAWYDGTGRLISSLPDSAAVSAIASSYAESAASSKLDESATADFYSTSNPSGFVDSSYVDSAVSSKQDTLTFGYDGANISSIDGSALAGGGAAFPAYITSGTTVKAEITTGFQGSTATRPTLFISGTPTSNAYPRMLLSENHTAATCKSSTYLADAFEFYTGDPGSAGDKIFRADTAQVSASGRFVINSSCVSGAQGWTYGSAEYGQLTGVYDTVSSNSATWGGGGGGGIDSATCSAIASSYAESAVSSKADSSALSSYALSADVSGTVDLVSTQSANWGGSALALSAGPGVSLTKSGYTLVASTDNTVLFDAGDSPSQAGPWQISEARTNFEWLDIVFGNDTTGSMKQVTRFAADSEYMKLHLPRYDEEPSYKWSTMTLSWNNTTASIKTNSVGRFTIASNGSVSVSTAAAQAPYLFQIIGINRTAEA